MVEKNKGGRPRKLGRRKFEEFIEVYRKHECLWNAKSPTYKDKSAREKAYDELIQISRKNRSNATLIEIKRKISTLNFQCIEELKKEQIRTKLNARKKKWKFHSSLWYYNLWKPTIDAEHTAGDSQLLPIEEFIEMYRSHECLWNLKSPSYKDNSLRDKAYDELLQKVRERNSWTTLSNVKHRIIQINRHFQTERRKKKIIEAMKNVHNKNWKYKSKGKCYDLLKFTIEAEQTERDCQTEDELTDWKDALPSPSEVYFDSYDPSPFQIKRSYSDLSSKSNDVKLEPRDPSPTQSHETPFAECGVPEQIGTEDEFDIIGKNVAIKLRKLQGETNIITERLIMDVLFQAELGNIRNTTQVTFSNIQNISPDTKVKF